jgi:hypothetical protein
LIWRFNSRDTSLQTVRTPNILSLLGPLSAEGQQTSFLKVCSENAVEKKNRSAVFTSVIIATCGVFALRPDLQGGASWVNAPGTSQSGRGLPGLKNDYFKRKNYNIHDFFKPLAPESKSCLSNPRNHRLIRSSSLV